jgi:hypothetical protein
MNYPVVLKGPLTIAKVADFFEQIWRDKTREFKTSMATSPEVNPDDLDDLFAYADEQIPPREYFVDLARAAYMRPAADAARDQYARDL